MSVPSVICDVNVKSKFELSNSNVELCETEHNELVKKINEDKRLKEVAQKEANVIEQKEILLFRSCIALQNFRVPIDEIDPSNSSTEFSSVRLLAQYFSDPNKRPEVLQEMRAGELRILSPPRPDVHPPSPARRGHHAAPSLAPPVLFNFRKPFT